MIPSSAPRRTPDRTSKKVRGIDWVPPHQDDDLRRIAENLRAGLPVDAVYDALDAVLGESAAPDGPEIARLTRLFHGWLTPLINAVLERAEGAHDSEVAVMVDYARALSPEVPQTPTTPLAYLRRLAHATQGLLDVLLEDGPPQGLV